jgi:hypothetical protein
MKKLFKDFFASMGTNRRNEELLNELCESCKLKDEVIEKQADLIDRLTLDLYRTGKV